MQMTDGGITAPRGFRAAATAAGIKYRDRTDMALIVSDAPCRAAGVFTRNVVQAAPVQRDREIVQGGQDVRAIVVNAGIANACTGEEGRQACKDTARYLAEKLHVSEEAVLVASTGVIGMQLPMDRVRAGIDALAEKAEATREAATDAANAILTTDTRKKECCARFLLDNQNCHIAAIAKGSGMIHPNMGTMLCFITTDVMIDRACLQRALSAIADDTFNMISVDGDTSTNDTVLLLANGMAGNAEITGPGEHYDQFYEALLAVCREIAMMLAGDGEGATALLEVRVRGAKSREAARRLARTVVSSSLTKAAIYGHDANWGRILCALGYAEEPFDPDKVTLVIKSDVGSILLFDAGSPQPFDEEEAKRVLSAEKVSVLADLHGGGGEATAWGCDLSEKYVFINADYRS